VLFALNLDCYTQLAKPNHYL